MRKLYLGMLIALILILIYLTIFMFFIRPSKPLPVDYDSVTKIELYHIENNQAVQLLSVEDKDDIDNIGKIIRKSKGGWKDSPACPFGLSMIFYEGDNKIPIKIGTDDCGLIKYGESYYALPNYEIEPLQSLIEQLTGSDFDKLRL